MNVVELDAGEIRHLLDALDGRLRRRGVAASVYVVGGAAVAVTVQDSRRTADVDGIVSDDTVLEEARALALEEGLPPNWLNGGARPWVPPRPASATATPRRVGLTIHYAPPEHLLAMKLVAARPQDAPDILALAEETGLRDDAQEYADLLERVYTDEGALQQQLGVPFDQVRTEAVHRGDIAARLWSQAHDPLTD